MLSITKSVDYLFYPSPESHNPIFCNCVPVDHNYKNHPFPNKSQKSHSFCFAITLKEALKSGKK